MAGVCLALVAATCFLVIQPVTYTSTVNVVPLRARTEVSYEDRIRTVSSEGRQGASGQPTLPSASAERRQALAQLVRSGEVERAVRAKLGDQLPPALREPGALSRLITARVIPRSELIAIEVNAPSATLAEEIAAAWAQSFERQVNELYSSRSSDTARLEQELAAARQNYESAENALTAFIKSETLGANMRLLEAKQRQLNDLISVRHTETIDLYKVAHRIDLLIAQTEALQAHLAESQSDGATASNAAALMLIKTQAFASSMTLPSGLQLQLPARPAGASDASGATAPGAAGSVETSSSGTPGNRAVDAVTASDTFREWSLPSNLVLQLSADPGTATLAQQRADAAAIARALQDWRQRLAQSIQEHLAVSTQGGESVLANQAGISQAITSYEADIRELQGNISDQAARQRSLQRERDVLWESYGSVLKKTEELRIADLVGNSKEVSIAGQTIVEQRSKRFSVVLPLAALLGATIAILAILGREYFVLITSDQSKHINGPVAEYRREQIVHDSPVSP
jgi:hypothetical protein